MVHQAARGRLRGDRSIPDIVREMASLADGMTMCAKKDGHRQHRRLAGHERRRLGRAGPQPADPDRGLPDLRRARRARPRGDRRRACARSSTRTTCATGSARPRTSARRWSRRASRASSRSAGTRSTSTPRPCCRTSRRWSIPARRWPWRSTARAASAAARSARSCSARRPDGTETPAPMELVRLAIPRRVYTQSAHRLRDRGRRAGSPIGPAELRGLRIVEQPAQLRHFTARFEPLRRRRAGMIGSCDS